MIKPFRLRPGGTLSCIKVAESSKGYPVHIGIHGFQIIFQQCLYEFIIAAIGIGKPSPYHIGKHNAYFLIGQHQTVIPASVFLRKLYLEGFQVAACKQQAPDRISLAVQLAVHNLLVNLYPESSAFQ